MLQGRHDLHLLQTLSLRVLQWHQRLVLSRTWSQIVHLCHQCLYLLQSWSPRTLCCHQRLHLQKMTCSKRKYVANQRSILRSCLKSCPEKLHFGGCPDLQQRRSQLRTATRLILRFQKLHAHYVQQVMRPCRQTSQQRFRAVCLVL